MLGERHELVWEKHSPLRVLPAHQRLHARHLAGREVSLRLVVDGYLSLCDGTSQLRAELCYGWRIFTGEDD